MIFVCYDIKYKSPRKPKQGISHYRQGKKKPILNTEAFNCHKKAKNFSHFANGFGSILKMFCFNIFKKKRLSGTGHLTNWYWKLAMVKLGSKFLRGTKKLSNIFQATKET